MPAAMDSSLRDPDATPEGRARSTPTRTEWFAGIVTIGSWIGLFLAIGDRIRVGRPAELALVVLAGASTLVTFAVSSRKHASEPQPRSVVARVVVWGVILATLAGIAYLVVVAALLRERGF